MCEDLHKIFLYTVILYLFW